jgi:26S proteasome regulatory subunit N12
MYLLFALNLTLLLAQNKISEFYTQLELLPVDSLKDNVYIKFALHLATSLLEGSYNNILKAKTNIPSEEFSFFVGLLIGTSTSETGNYVILK